MSPGLVEDLVIIILPRCKPVIRSKHLMVAVTKTVKYLGVVLIEILRLESGFVDLLTYYNQSLTVKKYIFLKEQRKNSKN